MCSLHTSEAAIGDVLWKKVFLKILQNSQENICVGVSFFIKLFLVKFIEHIRATGSDLYSKRFV